MWSTMLQRWMLGTQNSQKHQYFYTWDSFLAEVYISSCFPLVLLHEFIYLITSSHQVSLGGTGKDTEQVEKYSKHVQIETTIGIKSNLF